MPSYDNTILTLRDNKDLVLATPLINSTAFDYDFFWPRYHVMLTLHGNLTSR